MLSITGNVNLANARLSLALLDAPAGLAAPLTFLLIVKDGSDAVAGTFAAIGFGGMPAFDYTIDYAFGGVAVNGIGTGNDIAITFVPEPSAGLLLALIAASALHRRAGRSGGRGLGRGTRR